ncbi:MAG: carbohydrate-binding domain-containing protein, partial [Bacillota bacterium]
MKETGKKALTVLMALCMALTLMPQLAPNAAAAGGSLRTEALDLTVLDTDTVNTAEGWAWYAAASGDYSAKTLVLDGLNLQASDYYFGGLVLPGDSTIVLAEDSVNTVSYNYAASYGFYAAYGVFCNGSLTIQGDGAISVFSTTSSSIFNAGIYTASGNLTIESGTVTATALYGSNCYGLYSNAGVVISDGAVT